MGHVIRTQPKGHNTKTQQFKNSRYSAAIFTTLRTCLYMVEDRYGHSPLPLSADAPVTPALCHVGDPIEATDRNPRHITDGRQSRSSKSLDRCKPLACGPDNRKSLERVTVLLLIIVKYGAFVPENSRFLSPPVIWVLVFVLLLSEKSPHLT